MFRAKRISVTRGELNEVLDQLDDVKKALYAADPERAIDILNMVDSQLNELLCDSRLIDLECASIGREDLLQKSKSAGPLRIINS